MDEIAKHCFDRITAQTKRPLFVAIAGDSGSGKSYLVALLEKYFKQAHLPYTLINHDEFLISRKDREPMKSIYYQSGPFAGKSRWEILENMFRLDEYERVIRELRTGKSTEFHPYSRNSGTVLPTTRKVEPKDFVIFDTSMMLDEMDFTILVDVTQEISLSENFSGIAMCAHLSRSKKCIKRYRATTGKIEADPLTLISLSTIMILMM